MKFISFVFAFCILFMTKHSYADSNISWKVVKKSDGIQIETRKETGSEYLSFRASMTLETNLESIVTELKKVDQYPDWFAFTKSAILIQQSKNEQIVLIETNFPWPYQNEYMEYHMVFLRESDGSVHVNLEGISKSNDSKQGLYPLKKAKGYIKLFPLPSETKKETKIVYQFHSEPKQEIPTWLINPMIHEMPFQTFLGLRERLCSK